MRIAVVIAGLLTLSCGAYAQVASRSYWLLLKNDGHTWCGYADSAEFTSDVKNLKPTESARVMFSSDKLIEVTYQLSAESGDWVVVDKYTPSNDRRNFAACKPSGTAPRFPDYRRDFHSWRQGRAVSRSEHHFA
jgi:hypothetical protein